MYVRAESESYVISALTFCYQSVSTMIDACILARTRTAAAAADDDDDDDDTV